MKGIFGLFLLVVVLASCNDEGKGDQKLDSLEQKLEVGFDSTKAEVKEIRDSVKSRWERRKDSTDKDSVDRNW